MSEAFVEGLSEVYLFIFLSSCAAGLSLAPFIYWRIYLVYKKIGEPARDLGFLQFAFQFQMPVFSRGMLNYRDVESLSDSSSAYIDNARRLINLVKVAFFLWLMLVVAFGITVAILKRHIS